MAVKKIPVPFCDWCGLPFLPKMLLRDGTRNPIFDKPELSKRCGKCKRTGWNAGGVDRRRKPKAAAEKIPQVTAQDVAQTIDVAEPGIFPEPGTLTLPPDDAALIEMSKVAFPSSPAPRARRCRHGLFKCGKCDEGKAA